jgi:ribosome maturation factor RimP
MNVEKELNEIVSTVLSNYPNVFHVQSVHKNQNHEIIIDGDEPMGIYDISAISREINQLADERMPEASYSLEIASPGADSDLLYIRQFPKHVNRTFNVHLKDHTNFEGKLKEIINEVLTFEVISDKKKPKNTSTLEINYVDIKKANIILSFK